MNLKLFQWPILYTFLELVDKELAEATREEGCPCGGVLHRADYPRKPRGGPEARKWARRSSFCCAEEGCRRRRTPPSVRFLGRRVYVGVVVVLVSAMMHGPTPRRAEELHQELGIDRRTLERWRKWWLEEFVETTFWKTARGRFMPGVEEGSLPYSLVARFEVSTAERMVELMRFLSPITTPWGALEMVF